MVNIIVWELVGWVQDESIDKLLKAHILNRKFSMKLDLWIAKIAFLVPMREFEFFSSLKPLGRIAE